MASFCKNIVAVLVILERFAIYWEAEPGRLDICNVEWELE